MKRDGSSRGGAAGSGAGAGAGGVPCKLPLARLGALLPRLAAPAPAPAMPPPPARALCLYCERTFTSAQLLHKHAARVHLLPPNRRQSSRHSPAPDSFHPGCNLCAKNSGVQTASDLPALFNHFIDKHPTQYFACATCTLRFSTQNILTSHHKDIHGVTPNDSEYRLSDTFVRKDNMKPEENICLENDISSKGSGVSDQLTCEVVRYDGDNINMKSFIKNDTLNIHREVVTASIQDVAGKKNIKGKSLKKTKSQTLKNVDTSLNDVSNNTDASQHLENNTPNMEGLEDFEENIVANLIMPRRVSELDQFEKHANKKKLLLDSNGKKNVRENEPSVSLARLQFKSESKDSPMLSRLGLTQNRSPRAQSLRRCRKAPVTESRSASEVSRKDKLKAKNNDDFIINKSKNDPSTKFDPDFYCKVSANVRENILEHLDGKLGKANAIGDVPDIIDPKIKSTHAVMPSPLEQPAEIHGSDIRLNAITVFPTLLTSDQYGSDKIPHYSYGAKVQTFKKIITKNSWKWKWDPIKKYKYCNEDGKIVRKIKPLLHMSPRDLSKLDIWTQLSMREKYDKCVERKAPDINEGGKCERQKQINELNTILDSRVFPQIECTESSSNEREKEEVQVVGSREAAEEKEECNPVLAGLGLVRSGGGAGGPAGPVLTGEWARPRCYVCCVCGRRAPCLRLLQAHQASQHPHVHATHYELVGQELLQTQLYKHLYLPGIRRGLHQVDKTKLRKQTIARQIKSAPRNVSNTRILRTTTRTIKSLERECTKCKKSLLPSELYRHILECAGDYGWIMAKKKCKYKPFGARRRKLKGLYKRERPQDDEDKSEIKERVTRPKLPSRPRTKPSDAETIERMLANLPAKRASRQIMSIPSPKIRPFKKQGHIVRHMVSTKTRIQRSKMMCTSSVITVTEGLGKKIRRVTRSVANTVQALQQRNYLRNRKTLACIKGDKEPAKSPLSLPPRPAEEILEPTSPVPTKPNKMSTIKKKSSIVSTSKSDLTISSKCKKEESLPRLSEEKKSKHYNRVSRYIVSSVEVAKTNNEEIKTKKQKLQRILRRRPVLSSKIIDSSKSLKKRTLRKSPVDREVVEESSGVDDDIVLAKIDKDSFSSQKHPLKVKEPILTVDKSTISPTRKVKKNARKSLGFPLKWIGRKKTRGGKPKDDQANQELEIIPDEIPKTEDIIEENCPKISEIIEETSTVETDSDKLHREMSDIHDSEPLSNLKSNIQTIATEVTSDPSDPSGIVDKSNEIVKVSSNKSTTEPEKSSDLIIVASRGNWNNPGFPQARNTSNKELPPLSFPERDLFSNSQPGQTASIVNKEILTNFNQGKYSFQESVEIINKINSKITIEPVRPLNNAEEFEIDNIDKPPLFSHVSSIQSKLNSLHQLNPFANYEQHIYSAYELQHANSSMQANCLESDASSKHLAKIKAAKSRRGLNDCIAMLKGKLNDKPDIAEKPTRAISMNAASTIEKIQDLPLATTNTVCSQLTDVKILKEIDNAPLTKAVFPADSLIAATVLPVENATYFPAKLPTENMNYFPALISVSPSEKKNYFPALNTILPTEKKNYFTNINTEMATENLSVSDVMNTECPSEKINYFPVTSVILPTEKYSPVTNTTPPNEKKHYFPVSSAVMLLENKNNIKSRNAVVPLELKNDSLITDTGSPTKKTNYLPITTTVLSTEKIKYSSITNTVLPSENINYSPITNTVLPTEKIKYSPITNTVLPTEKINYSPITNTVLPAEKINYSPITNTVLPTEKINFSPITNILPTEKINYSPITNTVLPTDRIDYSPITNTEKKTTEKNNFPQIKIQELPTRNANESLFLKNTVLPAEKSNFSPAIIPVLAVNETETATALVVEKIKDVDNEKSESESDDDEPLDLSGRVPKAEDLSFKSIMEKELNSSLSKVLACKAVYDPTLRIPQYSLGQGKSKASHTSQPNKKAASLPYYTGALEKKPSLPPHQKCPSPPREHKIQNLTSTELELLPKAFLDKIESLPVHHRNEIFRALPNAFAEAIQNMQMRCKTVKEVPRRKSKPDGTQRSALPTVNSEPVQTSGRLTSEISTQTLASAQPAKASQPSPEFTNLDTDHFLIDPVTGSIIERTNIEEPPISIDPQNDLLSQPDNNSPVILSLPTTNIKIDNVIDLTNESHDIDYPRNSKIEGSLIVTSETIEQGIDSRSNESPHNTAVLATETSPKGEISSHDVQKASPDKGTLSLRSVRIKTTTEKLKQKSFDLQKEESKGLHPEVSTEISNQTPQAEVIDNVNIPTENTISSSKDLGLDSGVSGCLVNVALKLSEPAIQQDEVSSTQHSVAEDSSDFSPTEYVNKDSTLPTEKLIPPAVDFVNSESNDVVMTDKLNMGSDKQSENLSILLTPTRTFRNSFKNLIRTTEVINAENAGDPTFNEKSQKKTATKRKKGIKLTPDLESKELSVQTSEEKDSENIPVVSEHLEKSSNDFDGIPETVTCEQQKTSFNKLLMIDSNILSETALTPSNVIDFHPVSSEKCETSQINELDKSEVKDESIVRRSSRKSKSKLPTKQDEKISDKKSESLQSVENCNDVLNPDISGAAIIPGESCQAKLGEAGVSPSRDRKADSDDEDDICLAVVAKKKAIIVPTAKWSNEITLKESICTDLATCQETISKAEKVTGKRKNKTVKRKVIKKSKHKVQSRITRSRFVEATLDGTRVPAVSNDSTDSQRPPLTDSTTLKSVIPLKKRKLKAFEDDAIPPNSDVRVLTEEEQDESLVFRSDKLTDEESSQNNDQIASVNYVKLNENGHLIFKMFKKVKKTRQIEIKDNAKKLFGSIKNRNKVRKDEPAELSSVVGSNSIIPVDILNVNVAPTCESPKQLSEQAKSETTVTRKRISNRHSENDKNEENKEVTIDRILNSDPCIPPDDQPLTAFAKIIKSTKKKSSKIEKNLGLELLESLVPKESEPLSERITVVDMISSALEKTREAENEVKSKAGKRKKKSTATTNMTDDFKQEEQDLSESTKVNASEVGKESEQNNSKVLHINRKEVCETTAKMKMCHVELNSITHPSNPVKTDAFGDDNKKPVKSTVKENKTISDLSSTINESQESPISTDTIKSRRKSPRDIRKNGETLLNYSNLTDSQLCIINKCPENQDNVISSMDNIDTPTADKINKKSMTEGTANEKTSLEAIVANPKESIFNNTSDGADKGSTVGPCGNEPEVKEAPSPGTGKKDKSLAQHLEREDKTAKKLKKSDVIIPETKAKKVSKKLIKRANENLPKRVKGSRKVQRKANDVNLLPSPVDENEPLSNSIKSLDLRGSEYVFEDSDFENLSDIAFSYKKLKEKKTTDKIQLKDSKIDSLDANSDQLDLNVSDQLSDSKIKLIKKDDETRKNKSPELAPLSESKNEIMKRYKTQKTKSIELAPLSDSKNDLKKDKTQKTQSIELAPLSDSKNDLKKDKTQKTQSIELASFTESKNEMIKKDKTKSFDLALLSNSKNEIMKKDKTQKIKSIEIAPLSDSVNEMLKKDKTQKTKLIKLGSLSDSKSDIMKKDKTQKTKSNEIAPLSDSVNELLKKDKTQKIKSIEIAPLSDPENEVLKKDKTKLIELGSLSDSENEMMNKDKSLEIKSIELAPLLKSKNEMTNKDKSHKIKSIELYPLADFKNEMMKKDKSQSIKSIELNPLLNSKNEMVKKDKTQKLKSLELTPLAESKNEILKKDNTQNITSTGETKHSRNEVLKSNSYKCSNILPVLIIKAPDPENDDNTVKKKALRKKLLSETDPELKASAPTPMASPATGEQLLLEKSNARRNKQTMTTRAKRISQRRSTLATCESINTNELDSSDDESIEDKYLANFGIFTEKRPRKSTLLAIKKISQTFRPETSDTDDLDLNSSSQLFGRSDRPQKKKTRKVSTNQDNVAADPTSDNLKPSAESTPKGATLSQSTQYADDGLSTDGTLLFSKEDIGNEAHNYCSICNRKFRRAENLVKHKMTLMHISKLSEMEAKTLKSDNDEPIEEVIDDSISSKKCVGEPVSDSIPNNISRAYKSLAERKSFNNDDNSLECTLSPDKQQPTSQENMINSKELLEQSLSEVNSSPNNDASRKTLSCDEALFFECCSLLKESKSTRKDVKIVEPFKSSKTFPNSTDTPDSANTYDLNLQSYAKEFEPRMEDFDLPDISIPVGVEEVFYDCTDQMEPFDPPISKSTAYDFDTLNKDSAKKHTINRDISVEQTAKSTVEEMDEKSCGAEFDPYSAESLMVRSNSDDFSDNGDSMLSTHDTEPQTPPRSSNECKPSEPEPFNPLMEFEDKFDKIKRKAREKAQAAQEAITAAITPRGSKRTMKKNRSKSRKSKGTHEEHSKPEKSLTKDSSINKKRSHGSLGQKANSKKVLTKGALKGFDGVGVKVSILTNEINLHSILDNNKLNTHQHAVHEHSSKKFNSFDEKIDKAESNISDMDKGTNDSDETTNSKMTKKQRTKKLSSKQKRSKVHQENDRSAVNNVEPVTPTNVDKQHLDVYDFFDEDEDDVSDNFKFRTPATLSSSKDKMNTNKKSDNLGTSALSPNKNNLETQNEDSQISSLSFSDRDDFTYMSDDYRANESEDETNHSSVDMSANTSKSNKKHKRASKNQTNTKKSAIMGKIFKNNAIRNDQKNANHNANETESDDVVTTGQTDMDQLFDSLLEQTIANNNESKKSFVMNEDADSASRDAVATDVPEDTDVRSPSADEYSDNDESIDKDIPPYPRVSKRKIVPRLKARSSDDELPRNPSPAKQPAPKVSEEDAGDGDIGVASHKSQRKCTTGKQNVLVESWSSESDYEDFRQFEEYSSIPRTQGHHRKPRRSGRNRHSEDGKNSVSDQNTKSDLVDQRDHSSTSEKNLKIRFMPEDEKNHKNFQETPDTKLDSFRNQSPCEENYPEKSSERQSCNSGRRVSFNTSNPNINPNPNPVPNKGRSCRRKRRQSQKPFDYDDEFKPTRIAEPPSTQRRNKRAASEMLYYWSSSSEDDAQSASVDNNSRDPEPIEQHGWIVGDSHKKLVTMLAHAKGRKIDDNATVKEKRSRPST